MARVGVWRVTAASVNTVDTVYHVLAPNIPAAAMRALSLDSQHPEHLERGRVVIERVALADFEAGDMVAPSRGSA